MSLSSCLRRLAVVAAGALPLVAAQPAAAQDARDWSVCFTSGIRSCTDLFLTTTPQLVGATRTGTLVELVVRHRTGGGIVSGLMDVSFDFAPAGPDGDASPLALTPLALFGAPPAPVADG